MTSLILQTPADREFQELLAALADSGLPAPWDDAAPSAVVDDDRTDKIEVPTVRRATGEHPAWTAGIARATRQLEARINNRPKTGGHGS